MGARGPITVLMPFRDAADTLEAAVDSVLSQRGVDVSLVAVDDGSRDGGARLLARCAGRSVRILETGGAGLVAALERGRAEVVTPLLGRMDADDVAHPDRLAEQMDALEAQPAVAALGCQVSLFADDGTAIGEGMRAYVAWQNALLTPDDHRRELFVESPLCHPSVVIRTAALAAVGGYREVGWPEDYDLWLRLDAAGWGLAKLPAERLSCRHRPGRATFADPRYHRDRFLAARAAFLAPRLRRLDRPVWVWGAGRTGRRLARALEPYGVRVASFVDIDPKKIGRTARGAPIHGVDALEPGRCFVVVAVGARGARQLVRAALVSRGFEESREFLVAS